MPKNTASTIHVTAGSFLRVIWYACHTWWYQRVFLTLAGRCSGGGVVTGHGPEVYRPGSEPS